MPLLNGSQDILERIFAHRPRRLRENDYSETNAWSVVADLFLRDIANW